jgi:hypothetical protein
MSRREQRIFEMDRKVELRLRLALKKYRNRKETYFLPITPEILEPEMVARIIERVRRL